MAPPPTSRWSPARTTAAPAPAATHWSPPASPKVVASLTDPNPLVAGEGFARLRAAGVEVEVGPGAEESRALNIGFFSRMVRKTPWVRMKVAASLDGLTALPDGTSQWITSEAARRRPCLARPRRRRADRHRHRAGRQPAAGRAPGSHAAPAGPGGGRQPPADAARRGAVPARPIHPRSTAPKTSPRRSPPCARAARKSCCCPARAARSTSPPCWPTWHAAASTNCTSRPATSSTARWCARDWWTSSWCTWRRSCWGRARAWPISGRWRGWMKRWRWTSRASSGSGRICGSWPPSRGGSL
jgi:hypothetical protein